MFEPEEVTQPTTVAPKELPVSGIEGAFKFDEYSDHIVLTQYVGKGVEREHKKQKCRILIFENFFQS